MVIPYNIFKDNDVTISILYDRDYKELSFYITFGFAKSEEELKNIMKSFQKFDLRFNYTDLYYDDEDKLCIMTLCVCEKDVDEKN